VFGGNIDYTGHYTKSTEIYDIATDTWAPGADMPIACQANAIAVGRYVYVFIQNWYVCRFDPSTGVYTKLTESLPMKEWYCFDLTEVRASI
jgi:hypothetical protein